MRLPRADLREVVAVLLFFLFAATLAGLVDGAAAVWRNGYLREGMTEILFWTLARRLHDHLRLLLPLAVAGATLFLLLRTARISRSGAVSGGLLPLTVAGVLYLYGRPYWPVYRESPGRLLGKTDVAIFAAAALLLLLLAAAWYARLRRRWGPVWGARLAALLTRPAFVAVLLGLLLSIHLLDRVDWSGRVTPRLNLILISLDTLRADRLGCYGYDRETSPNIDAFARENVRFARAVSQSSWTLPSHASLLTGTYPSVTGAVDRRRSVPPSCDMLAELLRAAGWEASAFTGGGFLNPIYGFDQGFRGYGHLGELDDEAVFRTIEEYGGRPFFLFLHTYRIHNYIVPPDLAGMVPPSESASKYADWPAIRGFIDRHLYEDLGEEDGPVLDHLRARYDAAIFDVDRQFGALIAWLRGRGLYGSTVVVLLSDHGEELGDHGRTYHGGTLYNEMVHVPLLIHVPGLPPGGRVVNGVVELMDVFPTVLDLLGVPVPVGIDAYGLVPRIEGREDRAPGPAFSEIASNVTEKYAVCDDSMKLIYAPADDHHPLPGDGSLRAFSLTPGPPWREVPIGRGAGTFPEAAPLRFWIARMARARTEGVESGGVDMGADLREELRVLGYVQ